MTLRSYYYLSIFFILLLFACKKESTTWETDWSIPLIGDKLELDDLVNDSTLEANGVGGYNLILSRNLIELDLEDFVAIPDTMIENSITIAFPSLNVPPGFTISNTADETDISVADLELKDVHVKSGTIVFHVQNPIQTAIEFGVTLPGTTIDGVPFGASYTVPSANGPSTGNVSQEFDISGYSFDLRGLAQNKHNLFVSQIDVTSDPNGPTVTMTNTDSIKFFVEFKNIRLDYARGYFGSSTVSDNIHKSIDVINANQSGSLDIPALNIDLSIINGIKVGARATVESLTSVNSGGGFVDLSHNMIGSAINLDPATGYWSSLVPSVNTISFNSSNSNIEAFIENLGKDYFIDYQIELNPYGNISGGWDELFPQSKLALRTDINMPLQIGLDQFVLRDTFDLEIDPQQLTNVQEGSLMLHTQNAFPLSADIQLRFINKNGNTMFTVNSDQPIRSSELGSVSPNSGLMVSEDQVYFTLNSNELDALGNTRKIIAQITLNTPDPVSGNSTMVDIPFGAFMDLQLSALFKLKTAL